MSGMVGPLETSQLEMIDSSTTARCGKFALSYENARLCLDGLGVWVLETLDTLSQDDVSMLVTAIAQMLCQLAQGLHAVVAERDCVNDAGEEFPPVLPHQLARVDVRRFSSTLNAHKTRIQAKFDDQQIDELNQQFVMFLRAYREERAFKDAIDQCDNFKTDFKKAWSLTNGRFPMLSLFCGGLASAFPNTSTVESDFSLLRYEKDDTRKCLTDFSLDGIFHCMGHTLKACFESLRKSEHVLHHIISARDFIQATGKQKRVSRKIHDIITDGKFVEHLDKAIMILNPVNTTIVVFQSDSVYQYRRFINLLQIP
ncbi:hypothetical protein BASA62_007859 [Batrachochytrium salamandrivorans]|nr:hypothetical protein BASA62_007859 [Batrachochytrium salamandrivorans]